MRAVLRLGLAIAVLGLGLGQSSALAQSAAPATTNTPAPETIGPRELQNFNLQGTVSRPAEQAPATKAPTTAQVADALSAPASDQQVVRRSRTAEAARPRVESPAPAVAGAQPSASPPAVQAATAAPVAAATLPPVPAEMPASLAPDHNLLIWPWLLAALALGAGGAFFLWRRNLREAYAGGAEIEEFVAPEPQPEPPFVPQPVPRAAPTPAPPPPLQPVGFVSSRMRPWIEIGHRPLRCIVEDQGVTFEFELELFNSGNAPARDVLIGAKYFNAGPTQDQEIQSFFASSGTGDRIPVIPPLQRINLRPQLAVPLDQIRMLEAGGRRLFVPLIALNAIYGGGRAAGQTAAAWLVGRETKGEKLAPFRLDLGARVFRGLDARALPLSVRD